VDLEHDSILDEERYLAVATLVHHPKWRAKATDVLLSIYASVPLGQNMFSSYKDLDVCALVEAAVLDPALQPRVRSLLSSKLQMSGHGVRGS